MSAIYKLPIYLQKYCATQDYNQYTSQDHAVWRYIMRQSRSFFKDHAHSIYLEGLEKTGISITSIPRVEDIDRRLSEFGWGAVAVSGFIPPAAFMTFQALKILPIATQMRRIENIAYTPAPDIVHEAAGHAPILADKSYRQYLERYAEVARDAIISKQDLDIYEAIRTLSDVKEDPGANTNAVLEAQSVLDRALSAVTYVSEATKASRMAWWTTEYGLVDEQGVTKIYGAGLLSSVGEGQNCITEAVAKVPLTADCVEQGYDITKPQPQLFVAKNIEHLSEVLDDFADTLSCRRDARYGLEQAKLSKIVNTLHFRSGLQVSCRIVDFKFTEKLAAICIDPKKGQLCIHGQEVFKVSFAERKQWILVGCKEEEKAYEIGDPFCCKGMSGEIEQLIEARNGELLAVVIKNCTLKFEEAHTHYARSFVVLSDGALKVTGGTADRESFGDFDMGQASTDPGVRSSSDSESILLMQIYQDIRNFREKYSSDATGGVAIASDFISSKAALLSAKFPYEWLAYLELMELTSQFTDDCFDDLPWYQKSCKTVLQHYKGRREEWLIEQGAKLVSVRD